MFMNKHYKLLEENNYDPLTLLSDFQEKRVAKLRQLKKLKILLYAFLFLAFNVLSTNSVSAQYCYNYETKINVYNATNCSVEVYCYEYSADGATYHMGTLSAGKTLSFHPSAAVAQIYCVSGSGETTNSKWTSYCGDNKSMSVSSGCGGGGGGCNDYDGDGICDSEDNCPYTYNPAQNDGDGNGVGNACDVCYGNGGDSDGDGVCDNQDNCPYVYNPAQNDGDGNGVGNPCDVCYGNGGDNDNDGICDNQDCAPFDANFPQPVGTACNDGTASTVNDVIQNDGCTCAGTFDACAAKGGDNDGDGICNNDDCAPYDVNFPKPVGTACNDGNANTVNDVIQSDGCSCVGTFDACAAKGGDSDGDGICNNDDCAPYDFNFPKPVGTACNDGNANTVNDVIQSDGCSCTGTFDTCASNGGDSDGDGVCNNQDCAPYDANFPAVVGSSCNDGNSSTVNDVIQADGCTCAGNPSDNEIDLYCPQDIVVTALPNQFGKTVVWNTPTATTTCVNQPTACTEKNLAYWNVDNCAYASDFSGYTPSYPENGGCSSINVSRLMGCSHSCRDGVSGSALCTNGSLNSTLPLNNDCSVRFNVTLNAANASQLTRLSFYAFSPTAVPNTPGITPAYFLNQTFQKYGIIVKRNGAIIFQQEGALANDDWGLVNVHFGDALQLPTGNATADFEFQLIAFDPLGPANYRNTVESIWELDEVRLYGCCASVAPTTGSVSVNQTAGLPSGSNFPIGTSTITYQAVDDCGNTENCSFKVTVNPPADPCAINLSILNKTCNNNGTPSDPADDTYTFDVQVTGTGTSPDGYVLSYDNPFIGTAAQDAQYGQVITLGPFPAGTFTATNTNPPVTITDGLDINIAATDKSDSNCSANTVVQSPGPCSNQLPCAIQIAVNNVVCNDNGTPTDPNDDSYTFEILATATNSTSGSFNGEYSVSGLVSDLPLSGTYGVPFTLGPIQIGRSTSFFIRDNNDPNCTAGQSVNSPAACSNQPDLASIGNQVWNDLDNDGFKDANEPGLNGVAVKLFNANDVVISTTTTSNEGNYNFDNLASGSYSIMFGTPTGFNPSPQTGFGDDNVDNNNDNNPNNGNRTSLIFLSPGENNPTIDAGFFAGTVCDNLNFGGKIGFGNTCAGSTELCGASGTSPQVVNCDLPIGGSGTIEYIWLKNEVSCDGPTGSVAQMIANPSAYNWRIIPNSNNPSFNPGTLTTSTCFLRCARRTGCTVYLGESNIVRVEVNPNCGGNGGGTTTETCGNGTSITYGNGAITMEGGTFYQIFDTDWNQVYNCGWECGNSKTVDGLSQGGYRVIIKNSNYEVICEKIITLSANTGDGGNTGGGDPDNDGDGVVASQDCNDNDPNLTTVGRTCNDGNANTQNDVVQGNCTCAGTPIDTGGGNTGGGNTGGTTTESCDGGTSITYGNGAITMDGGSFYQILDAGWNEIYNCGWQCGDSKTVNDLMEGSYRIYIKNNNYEVICEKVITLSANTGGGGNTGGSNPDNDGDGVLANQDCNDNDANLTALGAACNDGNANTENDVVQSDCSCAGTPIDTGGGNTGGGSGNDITCGDIAITYGGGTIAIEGIAGQEYFFKINDLHNGWAQVGGCGWSCGHQLEATGLANSKYLITILNSDWSKHCEIEITMNDSHFAGGAGSRNAPQLSFAAYQANREVALQWLTNSGFKVTNFEVERSLDGEHFSSIAQFVNKEWSDELEYHQTMDAQPATGTNYYRVKEIYLNGNFAYTDVQKVGFAIDLNGIGIFPNPVQNELFVSLKPYAGQQGTLTLTNQFGQKVRKIELGAIKEDLIQMNTEQLVNGLYYLNVQIDKHKSFTKKVMVKHLY